MLECLESAVRQAGTTVVCNDVAKDNFFGGEASLLLQLVENLFHFVKHFGVAKLSNDEVVREEAAAKGFCGSVGIRALKELQSEVGVSLETKEGGEPEGRDLL